MDLNLLAGALRGMNRLGPGDVRGIAAATRVGVSVQALLPVVQAHGASTQFAQDLNRLLAQAVRGLSTVFVIEPPGGGKLRIEVDRQMIAVPSALRESILALVRSQQGAEPSAAAAKAPMPVAAQAAAAQTVAAQTVAAQTLGAVAGAQSWIAQWQAGAQAIVAAGGERAVRRDAKVAQTNPSATVRIDPSLLEAGQDAQLAAQRLRTGVEHSGLFFESHLGQWAAGERGMQALRAELASLQRTWHSAGEDAAVTALAKAGAHPDAQRVAAQLDVLQRASFLVQVQAWAGQACTISFHEDINPDDQAHRLLGPRAPAVVGATLELDLPRLGPLQVQLKLVGHTVALSAQAQAASLAQVQSGIGQLAEALQARGLTAAAISVRAVAEAEQ